MNRRSSLHGTYREILLNNKLNKIRDPLFESEVFTMLCPLGTIGRDPFFNLNNFLKTNGTPYLSLG